jgi:hypothetical protein
VDVFAWEVVGSVAGVVAAAAAIIALIPVLRGRRQRLRLLTPSACAGRIPLIGQGGVLGKGRPP